MKKFWNNIWGWVRPYLSWKMAPSLIIAWLITNGWCYIFIALGPQLGWRWMTIAGSTWAVILWMPFTIEKPITIAIAIWIHKKLFIKRNSNVIIKPKGDEVSE